MTASRVVRTFGLRFCLLTLVVGLTPSRSDAGTLISGPLLGYSEHREVLVWIEVEDAREVTLTWWPENAPETRRTMVAEPPAPHPAGGSIVKLRPGLLEPGQTYAYSLAIDGERLTFPFPLTFRTRTLWEWRGPAPDLSFLTGSCAYQNDPLYDRPGTPYGKGMEIFHHMAETDTDFMVWLGDNLYLREADWSSVSGIWDRYRKDRRSVDLQKLLATKHHWAIWDDHDFGPDNANRSFEHKETTLAAFNAYWGNPTAGEAGNPGIYTKFSRGDAAFILLDNRTYRDDSQLDEATHPDKTQYGAAQMDWLKQSLLQAQQSGHTVFKFIATGSQFLQTNSTRGESANLYRRERKEIIDFIRDQRITGVVFLTGDVHTTVLQRHDLPGLYPLYELTASPLTSGVSKSRLPFVQSDPNRVDGTVVADQNFCRIDIEGPTDERTVTIRCYDKTNTLRWTHSLTASQLTFSTLP